MDAPYRETEAAIAPAREMGMLAVEMEAELGGTDRGDIAAGTGADDDDVEGCIGHGGSLQLDFVGWAKQSVPTAAALYAFGTTSGNPIVCFAHVTNSMTQTEDDFEKSEADGATATRKVISGAESAWRDEAEISTTGDPCAD